MTELRGTLLADGTSDRMLLHAIRWLLKDLGVPVVELRWADPRLFPSTVNDLTSRAAAALDQEPCDVLFVHRDSEKMTLKERVREIRKGLEGRLLETSYVCIVPVRMTEAWFLFHEEAIRRAAGNPVGNKALNLPRMKKVESQPDPKKILEEALCKAASHRGRHLKRFKRDLGETKQRVAELISDYSPLRQLPGFRAFESELRAYLQG